MAWRQFVMQLKTLPADLVEAMFVKHGALAVTFTDAGDTPLFEPLPGETPLWRNTTVTGLFSAGTDFEPLRADLKLSLGVNRLPEHRVESLDDRAWEREWMKDFQPMQFGRRLWVCPGGFTVEAADPIVVRLDPGLAFGTGTHPTTALCLEWLEALELTGARVLDFGCGSGILSIAALLLGAREAMALDIDPQALLAARDNARRNGVDRKLETTLDAGNLKGGYDFVVANILAGPLVAHADILCRQLKTGGRVLLSGILDDQVDAVRDAYSGWIDFEAPTVRDTWVRLAGTRI
jgi:ribosomal protein L11 methyltransferase